MTSGGGGKKDWKKLDIPIRHIGGPSHDNSNSGKKKFHPKGGAKRSTDQSVHPQNSKSSNQSHQHPHQREASAGSNNAVSPAQSSNNLHHRFSSQTSPSTHHSSNNQSNNYSSGIHHNRKKPMQPQRRMGRTRSQMSYQDQPEMDQVQILIQWIIYQLYVFPFQYLISII